MEENGKVTSASDVAEFGQYLMHVSKADAAARDLYVALANLMAEDVDLRAYRAAQDALGLYSDFGV